MVPRAAAAAAATRRLPLWVFGKAAVGLVGVLHAVELPHHVVHLRAEDAGEGWLGKKSDS